MRKVFVSLLMLLLALPAVGLAGKSGIGISVGPLIPVVQGDQESGFVFNAKFRTAFVGPFVLEPNLQMGGFGNVTIDGVGSRDGSDIRFYGVDVILGGGLGAVGIKPYFFIGGGVYNTKRDGDETINTSGWSFGTGLAIGVKEYIDIDARGRINIISSKGSASRKSAGITFGLVYFFGQE